MNRFPRFAFLLALTLFFPALAFAQQAGAELTPVATDVTVSHFLKPLFGDLAGGGAGAADPMGDVLGKLNAVILIVGGVLLSYGLIAGTMQTAHDGEVLGKRWSSMWIPIRTALGTSALVPLGKGYCAIQYVAMWLVLQGVGGANLIWNAYTNVGQTMPELVMSHDFKQVQGLAETALTQQLCAVTLNAEAKKAMDAAPGIYDFGTVAPVAIPVNGAGHAKGFTPFTCGSVQLAGGMLNTAATRDTQQIMSWFADNNQRQAFDGLMVQAHNKAFTAMQASMNQVAQDIYAQMDAGGKTDAAIAKAYNDAIDQYNDSLKQDIKSALAQTSNTSQVQQNAQRDGWGLAGAWYMKFVFMERALQEEIANYPKVTEPSDDKVPPMFKQTWLETKAAMGKLLSATAYKNELGAVNQANADDENSKSWFGKALSKIMPDFSGMIRDSIAAEGNNQNPVLAVSAFGSTLFNISVGAQFLFIGLAALPPTSSVVAGLPLIMALFGSMMAVSATLAFYLPVAPFILWFGVVVGWLIMVIEAVIAAPLWAVAHIHPDGDGIVGRGGQGYSLILALMLRPALAVVGLVAAMVVITPVGSLFNQTFWAAFSLGQNSSYGPFIYVASLCIFTMIYIQLVHKIFSLIHVIPDEILKWMGGPSGNLGHTANDLGQAGGRNAALVGGVVGGMAGNVGQGMNNAKQLRAARDNAAAQKEGNAQARVASDRQTDQKEGSGMAAARDAGDKAVQGAIAAAKKRGVDTSDPKALAGLNLEGPGGVRETGEKDAYNEFHGDTRGKDGKWGSGNAWDAREALNQARAKDGLGEATGAMYNRLQRKRKEMGDAFDLQAFMGNTTLPPEPPPPEPPEPH